MLQCCWPFLGLVECRTFELTYLNMMLSMYMSDGACVGGVWWDEAKSTKRCNDMLVCICRHMAFIPVHWVVFFVHGEVLCFSLEISEDLWNPQPKRTFQIVHLGDGVYSAYSICVGCVPTFLYMLAASSFMLSVYRFIQFKHKYRNLWFFHTIHSSRISL